MDERKRARARGVLGEVRAEQFLRSRGMEILARNATWGGAEIDLIARDGGAVVFVEVKTRASARGTPGRMAVTPAKQRRICRGALAYLAGNGLMGAQARFDVIEIQGENVTHIPNAFPYQGPAY